MMHAWWAAAPPAWGGDEAGAGALSRVGPTGVPLDEPPDGSSGQLPDESAGGTPEAAPHTPEELRRFEDYAGHIMVLWVPRMMALLALAILAFWPFDWVASAALRPALTAMRVNALLFTAVVMAVATFTGWATRAPRLFASLAGIGGVTVLGWSISSVGDLSTPWFHYITTVSALSAVIPVSLGPRFALAFGHAAGLTAGYFLPHLEYLDHPYAGVALGQALFGAGVAVAVGHGFYTLLRRWHVQSQRLAVQRRYLDHARATLEARVAEQTRELRRLAQHLDEAVQAERRELAQEIHDRLGQELTALGYVLAAARRRTEGAVRPLATAVEEADRLVERARTTMRRILARLGPQVLDRLGFQGAVRWAVRDVADRVGLDITLAWNLPSEEGTSEEATGGQPASASARVLFYAVVEGLNNVVRHARAHRVWVTLGLDGDASLLRVRDDGPGRGAEGGAALGLPSTAHEADAESLGAGLGLFALRERAEAAGGHARWGPHPAGGFELEVAVPREPGPHEAHQAQEAPEPHQEHQARQAHEAQETREATL